MTSAHFHQTVLLFFVLYVVLSWWMTALLTRVKDER